MPLRPGVQYPQHCFEHRSRGDGLATSTTVRNVLLREVLPHHLPLCVAQLHAL
jgi:hypothetical protein